MSIQAGTEGLLFMSGLRLMAALSLMIAVQFSSCTPSKQQKKGNFVTLECNFNTRTRRKPPPASSTPGTLNEKMKRIRRTDLSQSGTSGEEQEESRRIPPTDLNDFGMLDEKAGIRNARPTDGPVLDEDHPGQSDPVNPEYGIPEDDDSTHELIKILPHPQSRRIRPTVVNNFETLDEKAEIRNARPTDRPVLDKDSGQSDSVNSEYEYGIPEDDSTHELLKILPHPQSRRIRPTDLNNFETLDEKAEMIRNARPTDRRVLDEDPGQSASVNSEYGTLEADDSTHKLIKSRPHPQPESTKILPHPQKKHVSIFSRNFTSRPSSE